MGNNSYTVREITESGMLTDNSDSARILVEDIPSTGINHHGNVLVGTFGLIISIVVILIVVLDKTKVKKKR